MHGAHPLTTVRPRATPAIGSAPVRRGKAIGWTLVLGLVAWALAGRGLVNYDTLYALVWGRDLTHGTLPDYDVSLAPTPHPLATLAGARPLRPRRAGLDRRDDRPRLRLPRRARMGHLPRWAANGSTAPPARWRRRSCSRAAPSSTSARAPTSTSPTWRSSSAPCSSRRAAGARARPSSLLLGVAGLIRPEAWLFSGAYLIWLWVGGVRDPRLWALAAAAPLLWALGDLDRHRRPAALAHRHPRHGAAPAARHGPRRRPGDRAAAPGRDPARARPLRRRRRRAAGARVPAQPRRPRRRRRGDRDRRLLRARRRRPADPRPLPARAGDDPRRSSAERAPSAGPSSRGAIRGAGGGPGSGPSPSCGLVVFIPPQVDRIGNLRDALRIQDAIQDDLHALTPRFPCTPVTRAEPPPGAAAGALARRRAAADRGRRRSNGRAAGPTCVPTSRAWRASTSSTRATSTRASRRRRRASGPSGRTPHGAPSPVQIADRAPSLEAALRALAPRAAPAPDFPLRTPGSA